MERENLKFAKPISVKKTPKPIAKIGKIRKERINNEGKETDVFFEIWNERPHICEICSDPIKEEKSFCFAHKLPKGQYKEFRLLKENISLVCSIKCHQEVDKQMNGIKRKELFDKFKKIYKI